MAQIGMHEAKTKLSQLVERAESGEDIVIARNGKPVARLTPVASTSSIESVRGAVVFASARTSTSCLRTSPTPSALGEASARYACRVVVAER